MNINFYSLLQVEIMNLVLKKGTRHEQGQGDLSTLNLGCQVIYG